jgi:hypothetical protein
VRKEIFNSATEISKVDFFSFFQRFHDRTFKNPKIHQSAFRKTGLIPFDPSVVLEKMKEYQALQMPEPVVETPSSLLLSSSVGFTTLPLTPTNWNLYTTPLTMRSRKKGLEYVRSRTVSAIDGDIPITPSVLRVQDKVSQASERSMLAGALATNRVHDLTIAEAARKERKEASGKVVQKYGEIYGHQARRDIFLDDEEEKEVVNMRNNRLSKPWKKKYKLVMKELMTGFTDRHLKSTFTSAYTRS